MAGDTKDDPQPDAAPGLVGEVLETVPELIENAVDVSLKIEHIIERVPTSHSKHIEPP